MEGSFSRHPNLQIDTIFTRYFRVLLFLYLEPWTFSSFYLRLHYDMFIFFFFMEQGFKCSRDWTNAESTCTPKTADYLQSKWVGRTEWSSKFFGCHWHAPYSSIRYPSSKGNNTLLTRLPSLTKLDFLCRDNRIGKVFEPLMLMKLSYTHMPYHNFPLNIYVLIRIESKIISSRFSLHLFFPLQAFSGLQFLLHKAQVMQENHSKFSFPSMHFPLTNVSAIVYLVFLLIFLVLIICRSVEVCFWSDVIMAKDRTGFLACIAWWGDGSVWE